jgi:phosphogluconate dehydratase
MLMEIMGLHLPGATFVHPNTPLRDAFTAEAVHRVAQLTALGDTYLPLGHVIDEKAIVNGVIGLHATGGSTNHLLHLPAIARAAGIQLTWEDFAELSVVIPLLARVYPNGRADVNHFHDAGGMGFLIAQLLDAGLLHADIHTVFGGGLDNYRIEARLGSDGTITRTPVPAASRDADVLRGVQEPFRPDGGLRTLDGNLGKATIKVSSVPEERYVIEAPAIVFDEQDDVQRAFERGELDRDFVAVVRFQGPRANGMPELHKLTPALSILQNRGFRVALVTDGRMSGASGRVPAAIHVTPEAAAGGPIAKVRDGDVIRVDANANTLEVKVDNAQFAARPAVQRDLSDHHVGVGRELFGGFRSAVSTADTGASIFGDFA